MPAAAKNTHIAATTRRADTNGGGAWRVSESTRTPSTLTTRRRGQVELDDGAGGEATPRRPAGHPASPNS